MLYTNENFNNNLYPDVRLGVRGNGSNFNNSSFKKFRKFFESNEMGEHYNGINFYTKTLNLRNRVGNYTRRIIELDTQRIKLTESIHNYLNTLVSH